MKKFSVLYFILITISSYSQTRNVNFGFGYSSNQVFMHRGITDTKYQMIFVPGHFSIPNYFVSAGYEYDKSNFGIKSSVDLSTVNYFIIDRIGIPSYFQLFTFIKMRNIQADVPIMMCWLPKDEFGNWFSLQGGVVFGLNYLFNSSILTNTAYFDNGGALKFDEPAINTDNFDLLFKIKFGFELMIIERYNLKLSVFYIDNLSKFNNLNIDYSNLNYYSNDQNVSISNLFYSNSLAFRNNSIQIGLIYFLP